MRRLLQRQRRSEARYRRLFDSLPVGLYRVSPSGQFEEVNAVMARLLGYTDPQDLLETSAPDFFVDPEVRREWIRRIDEKGVVTGFRYRVRRRDGEEIWVEDHARGYRNQEGALSWVEGVVEDVTPQKENEDRLRETSEALRATIEAAPLGILSIDPEGRVRSWNAAAERIFGWSEEEVLDAPLPFVPPESMEEFAGLRRRILAGEEIRDQEITRRRRDGSPVDIALHAAPLRDVDGDVVGILGVIEDVTERRREEGFRRRLIEILEATSDYVGLASSDGRVLYRNRAGRRMLAMREEEEYEEALTLWEFQPPALRTWWEEEVLPGAMRDGTWEGEGVIRDLEGHDHRVSLVVIAHGDPEDEDRYISTVARDITRQKELEDQLRHAQKLEAMGRVTGGVAHDFNNLLTIIRTSGQLLPDHVDEDDDEAAALLDDLLDAVQRGADLVRRLLVFSRNEELRVRPVDLGAQVRGYAGTLRRFLPETIEVEVEVPDSLPAVRADPGAVEQILLNLATNARDSMPGGGRLTLRLAECGEAPDDAVARPPELEPGSWVCMEVSDTGAGMNRETVQKAFEPFFTTKAPGEGTGLGLALVYGMMQLQDGTLTVESRVGVGSTVRAYFAGTDDGAGTDVVEERQPALASGDIDETVLVVEDEPAIRRAFRRTLARFGYRVLMAENGAEGLRLYRERRDEIDLVLSDVVMPEMGGLELHQAVRREGGDVPFLFVSGYATRDIDRAGAGELPAPLLEKPWSIENLIDRVREILDGKADPKEA